MELLILIALAVIVYVVLDIHSRVKNYFKYKSAFDPDYPIYSAEQIWVSKTKIDALRGPMEEQWQKYDDYMKTHKEDVMKTKKNKDQAQELKDLMLSFHNAGDAYNSEVDNLRHMIEVNYEIRNSKKSYTEVSEELSDTSKTIAKILNTKSSYEKWLEHEEK